MRFIGQVATKSGRVDQLKRVFLVSEGWMSSVSEDKPVELPPSQCPHKMEVFIISGIHIKERKKQMKVFEILRDDKGKVTGLENLLTEEEKEDSVDTPLLDAFAEGFKTAYRIRYN